MRPLGVGVMVFGLVVAALRLAASEPAAVEPADVARTRLAEAVGKPKSTLRLLDQIPLEFAFVEGSYMRYLVRDLATGETLDVTLDLAGNRVVSLQDLKRRDRERAAAITGKLAPDFLDLVLAHPRLPELRVLLVFQVDAVRKPGEEPAGDWLEPELRDRFQTALDAERHHLGVPADLKVRLDWPVLEATLSVQDVIRLAQSDLIEAIKLMVEPEILDD